MASQNQAGGRAQTSSNKSGRAKVGSQAGSRGSSGTAARNGKALKRPKAEAQRSTAISPAGVNRSGAQNKAGQTRRARDRAKARELAERAAVATEPKVQAPPTWLQYATLVLAIGGLAVSIYLTYEHFTGNRTLACSDTGVINCGAVTTSPESMVFGVFPVAVLGLAFFSFMVPMTLPWAWRSGRREIALARLASVIAGVGFILYLIYVELFQVQAICLWCTSVHVMTFLLFALTVVAAAVWGLPSATHRVR